MKKIISPSFLSSDFLNLGRDIEMINNSNAEWFHLDVMDGVFVPNISYGMPIISAMRPATTKVLDAHLMIVDPDRHIEAFAKAGVDFLTVHAEAVTHLHRTIQSIHSHGMKAGVALNPHTSLSSIEEIVDFADMILLMSVNPGFGGQKFIPSILDKTARLKEMILRKNANTIIQIDGGVTLDNAKSIFDAGADCLVAGSSVFGSSDPIKAIDDLLNL